MEATIEQTENQETQQEAPKSVTQEDLNNLRSVKDKEIASVKQEMAALRKQVEDAKAPAELMQLTGDVDELIRQINNDPESYGKEVKRRIITLADEVHKARRAFGDADLFAKQQAAENLALKLQLEYGGDYQEYVTNLTSASTWAEMQILAKEKGIELREANSKSRTSTKIDEGTGRAAQSAREAVRKKLADIDVNSPNAEAELDKLKKEIDALNS